MGVINRNLYDPVAYMMKRFRRKHISGLSEEINNLHLEHVYEGGVLHRQGSFLVEVEGNEVYIYELYYNQKNILEYFVAFNRITGKVEVWSLEWNQSFTMLEAYNYETIHESEDSGDGFDHVGEGIDGYGEELDPNL